MLLQIFSNSKLVRLEFNLESLVLYLDRGVSEADEQLEKVWTEVIETP